MKISEVIEILNYIKELHGDLPCLAESETITWPFEANDAHIRAVSGIRQFTTKFGPTEYNLVLGYRHHD